MDYLTVIGHPVLFPLAVILATFLLEDPTTVGVAALINRGDVTFASGFFPLMIGIFLGDAGLYLLGTFIRKGIKKSALIPLEPGYFSIIVARFIPGMRTVTFTSAGIKSFPLLKFLALIFPSAILWTFFLISATDKILAYLSSYPVWFSICFGVFLIVFLQVVERKVRKLYKKAAF